MRILLDMDGVLVDFVAGACAIHGTSKEELIKKMEPGQYKMEDALGITTDEFWEPIHEAGAEFWLYLKPLPWVEDLLSFVESTTSDWYVVTAPSRHPSSYTGKLKWIKTYFGKEFDKFVLTQHKHLMAKPGTILIDDRDKNVKDFKYAGGWAVTFPPIHNHLHDECNNPVQRLRTKSIFMKGK